MDGSMLCQILRLGSPTSHLEMDTLDNAVRLSTRTVDQLMTLLKLTILQVIGNTMENVGSQRMPVFGSVKTESANIVMKAK